MSWLKLFKESKEELKEVTWPEKHEVARVTLIVLVVTVILSAFLWVVDMASEKIVHTVMSMFGGS